MTTDIAELSDHLCLLAGMIMEDVSDQAISRPQGGDLSRRQRLARLRRAGTDISVLLAAADVIERHSERPQD